MPGWNTFAGTRERESVPFANRIANPSQKWSEGFRHRGPRFLALRLPGIDFGNIVDPSIVSVSVSAQVYSLVVGTPCPPNVTYVCNVVGN